MKPVALPQGVKVAVGDGKITVEGPKGRLEQAFDGQVSLDVGPGQVNVSRVGDTKQARAYHGLYRNLLSNMVHGVSAGFARSLIVTGVGYKAEVKGDILTMSLGYSTDIVVLVPKGLSVSVEPNGKLTVHGIDKQKVGKFASEIRSLRLPEPYKGKGIRYEDERVRRKVGKSGVK
jgi:large subunit ribosomal protein L6